MEKVQRVQAWFDNEKDLQLSLNTLVQAGFDTLPVSLIMLDKPNSQFDEEIDNVNRPPVQSFLEPAPYDEENPVVEAYGTMWSIDSEDLDTEPISVPEIGEVVLAGPILKKLYEIDVDLNDELQQSRYYQALKLLGISDEEVAPFQERVKNGQIFVSMEVQPENKEEIEMFFSDNGGSLVEVF